MKASIIKVIFFVIFFVIYCVIYFVATTGGDPSDCSAENWFIVILLLLAWLKGN